MPRGSRSDAMSRYDDDDDKYNKAKRGGRPAAFSAAKAPHSARGAGGPGSSRGPASTSRSSHDATSSPAVFGGFGGNGDDADALAAKVRAKLDFVSTRASFDETETEAERVKASLDRLAFASQVKGVRSAFGAAINDAADEIDGLAHKAEETVAAFQAMQYAAKWMPVDTRLSMKPTYVKVPVQAVERIKFWEQEKLAMIASQHAEEKEKILAENAGLRAMMGLEEANSPAVEEMRETEDGVNRALLISAVEEIKQLRTRVAVLEGEAARNRVSSGGFGSFFGGGDSGGVDSAQMAKLTTELARLEEDNGRQKWMIGEKDKQIKEVQSKYAASAAYKLQEKLQESMEALEVMANLQAEQLQYMEDHALRKLDAQDTQIADVQDDLDTKRAHLEQLKTLMAGYWETGDDSLVPPMLSLAGFTKTEAARIARHREALADAGLGGLVRGLGRRGYGFYEKFLVACAPPAVRPKPALDGGAEGAEGGAEGGADASPAPSTAPPTAERMDQSTDPTRSDDDDDAERFRRAKQTNPFATSETVPESAAPTPEKGSHDGESPMTLPSPPEASAAPQSAPNSAPNSVANTASVAKTKTKPPRRRDGETPAERAAREAEKSARRERQRAFTTNSSSASGPPGSATRHRAGGEQRGGHFAGFDDEEHRDKERRERAKARAPLPAPKLKGRAAEAEARRRKEAEARRATGDGFAGFGSDETNDSDSD